MDIEKVAPEGVQIELDIEPAQNSDPLVEDGVEIVIVEEGYEGDIVEDVIPFDANLAEHLSEDDLNTLSTDLIELIESDIHARRDWVEMYVEGLDILGLKYEERVEPWDGACGVNSTVLAEAAIRFQADTMAETFPAAGPVKTKIIGKETKEKSEAAHRVQVDMNYQITEVMSEYRPEHERMLWALGLAGSAFKKVYFDPVKMRQCATYLPAEDVIVPYGASTIEDAERVTHIMRKTENEMAVAQNSGFYRDIDLGEPQAYHTDIEEKKAEDAGFELSDDNRYALYEVHVTTVIEGAQDGDMPRPYVVTIDRGTDQVLAIRRNWLEEDGLAQKRQHFVHYCYIPGFGFYGMGLIHIVGGYAQAGTSLIRQLVDAGTLANLPGGLKSRDLRVKGEDGPIGPGEWRDVDVPSGAIRDNLVPLPYKEPSATLAGLLDTITSEGRRLGAISDMDVSDMSANAPVGTTLAILERVLKPMSAVQARVHFSMKAEFKMLKAIIAEYAPQSYDYRPQTGEIWAIQTDYTLVDVIPVSDPNCSTMAQRVVQYQAAIQLAEKTPEIYDLPFLHKQMLEVLGIKNVDKIIPLSEDSAPQDPISENMGALVGTPMKAFLYQDHKAHIAAHTAFIQDPQIAQTIGQNPKAGQIMAAMQAHIAEHLGYSYRADIEAKLGVPLPPPDEKLPEEIEIQLSRVVADAGNQLSQQHKAEAAQKQNAAAAQDPNLQLSKMSEETKRMEVQRKIDKDKKELDLRGDEQQRKRAKDVVDAELKIEEIAEDRRETSLEAQRLNKELDNERAEIDRRVNLDVLQTLLNGAPDGSDNTGGGE